MEAQRPPDAQLGLRYDLEIIPINEIDNPLFETQRLSRRQEQLPAARRLRLRRRAEAASFAAASAGSSTRRIRADRRHLHGDRVRDLVQPQLPVDGIEPGRQRPVPDRSVPGQRPGDYRSDARGAGGAVSPGQTVRNTGATWDNPDRIMPHTDQITAGYERQLAGNMSVSADYVHAFSRDLLMSKELNPTLRATPVVPRLRMCGKGAIFCGWRRRNSKRPTPGSSVHDRRDDSRQPR